MSQPHLPAPSLADIGLYNLLHRIHHGAHEVDRFLWHSLVERQLVADGWPPRLTEAGLQQLQALAHRHDAAQEIVPRHRAGLIEST